MSIGRCMNLAIGAFMASSLDGSNVAVTALFYLIQISQLCGQYYQQFKLSNFNTAGCKTSKYFGLLIRRGYLSHVYVEIEFSASFVTDDTVFGV